MTSISRIPSGSSSDEIDLIALFQAIWQQKKMIIATTIISGMIALGYAYYATPEYQVTSVLRPAAINELDALNRSGVYTLPGVVRFASGLLPGQSGTLQAIQASRPDT